MCVSCVRECVSLCNMCIRITVCTVHTLLQYLCEKEERVNGGRGLKVESHNSYHKN